MRNVMDNEFSWEFFENTGSIESYLLYKEHNNLKLGTESNEYNSDNGTCAEDL